MSDSIRETRPPEADATPPDAAAKRGPTGTAAPAAALRRLVIANALSTTGDGVRFAALPLLAAEVTGGDPLAVSVSVAAGRAAWLLAPIIGTLVDHTSRRRAMVAADLVRAVALAALFVMVLADAAPIAVIAAVAFVSGVAEVFFDSAAQAAIPTLAGDEALERVNARLIAAQTVGTGFVGPPAGAALWVVWQPLPFLLNALTFLASAVLLRGLPEPRPAAGPPRGRLTARVVLADTWAGLLLLARDLVLRRLVLVVALLGIAQQAVYGILVLYVTRELGLPSSGYGWMLTAAAVGSLAGAKVAARIADRLGTGGSLVLSVTVSGATYLAIAVLPVWPALAVLLALNSAAVVLWNVVTVSLRQRLVPGDMLGRVTSGIRLAAWGVMPLGSILGGAVADRAGLSAPWVLSGVLLLACAPLVIGLRAPRAKD